MPRRNERWSAGTSRAEREPDSRKVLRPTRPLTQLDAVAGQRFSEATQRRGANDGSRRNAEPYPICRTKTLFWSLTALVLCKSVAGPEDREGVPEAPPVMERRDRQQELPSVQSGGLGSLQIRLSKSTPMAVIINVCIGRFWLFDQ